MNEHGPVRRAADRIWTGSAILRTRYTTGMADWVRDADSLFGRLVRLAMLGGLGYVCWWIIRQLPALMWLLTGAWCVAAYRAAPPPAVDPAADEGTAPAPELAVHPLLALVDELIGDGRAVHLATVLDHLQHAGAAPLTVPQLRAKLGDLGVPVRPSVKVRGRVSVGVHRDDLNAALDALSQPPATEAA